jgi:putative DNA primase/helicase
MSARYAVLPDHGAVVLPLWILHTYAIAAAWITPYLAITSPDKGCGKTTVQTILAALVSRPLAASNISTAAIFRTLEKVKPTLLIDEADSFLHDNEPMRGILDSGNTRATAFTVRCHPVTFEPCKFSTWGAKALALIGTLPATLADRSIHLRMRRKMASESIELFRESAQVSCLLLQRRCARWAADHLDELRRATPTIPPELQNRQADKWTPLLAIADVLGGEWPEKARRAATALTASSEDDGAGVMLLADLAALYAEKETDRLRSSEIVAALGEMETRPWPEWKNTKPISARQVARLLKPYGIHPASIRFSDGVDKGYTLEACHEAFSRYLSPSPPPFDQLQRLQVNNDAASSGFFDQLQTENVTDPKRVETQRQSRVVTDVTDQNRKMEGEKDKQVSFEGWEEVAEEC